MNHAGLLQMCDEVMPRQAQAQPPQPDYFERRGCYELARAILLDCLQQLAHDPEQKLQSTQMERLWLTGHGDHAPVSCAQVLATLGMHPDGRLYQVFVRIALTDPARAVHMLTSERARQAFREIEGYRAGKDGEIADDPKSPGQFSDPSLPGSAGPGTASQPWARLQDGPASGGSAGDDAQNERRGAEADTGVDADVDVDACERSDLRLRAA